MNHLTSDIIEICENIKSFANQFAGKHILITGGNGFLGKYFCEVFDHLNHEVLSTPCVVTVLDNFIVGDTRFESHPSFKMVQHNINDGFDSLDLGQVDYIVCCAGIASPFYYQRFPLETIEIVTKGLANSLELARKTGAKILYFSSSEIYGDPDPAFVPTDESYPGRVSCVGLRACYDESKRLGESLVDVYCTKYSTQAVVVRPFNVYGPGMQKNDYRVIPNFAAKIVTNEPLCIYGTGKQTRTFCYVSDAIEGFLRVLVLGKSGETYNIGNPDPEISMIELADRMEQALERPLDKQIIQYPDCYPSNEPNRRCPNINKASEQLDYKPSVSIVDGLRRFFSWAEKAYRE